MGGRDLEWEREGGVWNRRGREGFGIGVGGRDLK